MAINLLVLGVSLSGAGVVGFPRAATADSPGRKFYYVRPPVKKAPLQQGASTQSVIPVKPAPLPSFETTPPSVPKISTGVSQVHPTPAAQGNSRPVLPSLPHREGISASQSHTVATPPILYPSQNHIPPHPSQIPDENMTIVTEPNPEGEYYPEYPKMTPNEVYPEYQQPTSGEVHQEYQPASNEVYLEYQQPTTGTVYPEYEIVTEPATSMNSEDTPLPQMGISVPPVPMRQDDVSGNSYLPSPNQRMIQIPGTLATQPGPDAPRPQDYSSDLYTVGDNPIQQAGFQMSKKAVKYGKTENQIFQVQLEPPGPERLFKLESESALKERMRQEVRTVDPTNRVSFPKEVQLTKDVYMGRKFPLSREIVAPNYVCHKRLYFEQPNFERHGWDLGLLQPGLCIGKFYWDVFWFPYNAGTEPLRHYECSAGRCLPGDPAPLMLYPPNINATGLASQATAVTGAAFIFP